MICPKGYMFVEALMAWSFQYGEWIPVALCVDEAERGITVEQKNHKEVDIYQMTLPGKSFWVIDEEEECDAE